MNCKQGDIAVIVGCGDATGYIREAMLKVVGIPRRVVRLRPPCGDENCTADFVWHFDEPLIVRVQGAKVTIFGAADHVLRPLRDTDGEDEMLRIARLRPREMRLAKLLGVDL
ncbi:hypothetical protein [Azohydromonas lata]|uniref:hypothetical protein n=1 Tax=Azohydromonas lata TaxID=45677 RepID=UPI00083628D0|nr:hypothetical protein [Azohydromonas lata]